MNPELNHQLKFFYNELSSIELFVIVGNEMNPKELNLKSWVKNLNESESEKW